MTQYFFCPLFFRLCLLAIGICLAAPVQASIRNYATVEENSGALKNNFEREKVEDELNLQIGVTQAFGQNVQYVQGELRKEEAALRDAAKTANDPEEAARLLEDAENLQKTQVLINMVAGGLLSPTDSATGILASTLAPGISYKIGQYFKETDQEGSAAHLLAHTILGAAGVRSRGQ
jgi:filamentous hemagglutinin